MRLLTYLPWIQKSVENKAFYRLPLKTFFHPVFCIVFFSFRTELRNTWYITRSCQWSSRYAHISYQAGARAYHIYNRALGLYITVSAPETLDWYSDSSVLRRQFYYTWMEHLWRLKGIPGLFLLPLGGLRKYWSFLPATIRRQGCQRWRVSVAPCSV